MITVSSFADEIISQTSHQTMIGGQSVSYSATTGFIPMRAQDGKETGKIFYVFYQREGVDLDERPITFAFNGGPGSASIWLHMGAFGPKRIINAQEGQLPCPPYRWIENNDSLLDVTDLVFIDPIGTGFSRPAQTDSKDFYNIEVDIWSVGDFIRDFVSLNSRWKSPKYVAGESYGTLRACGLADYLLSQHGLYLNGLILISCAIDFQTLDFVAVDNELPFSLFLPSYAATAWYHHRLDSDLTLDEVVQGARDFALDVYAPALMRKGKVPASLYPEIAKWTGLSLDLINRNDGLIDDQTFFVNLLGDEKKAVGRFDGRLSGQLAWPRTVQNYYDPSEWQIEGVFTASFNAYLAEELGCKLPWPRYKIIANLPWAFGPGCPNKMPQLRRALVLNPEMRIFTACGYFDLATPFAAAERCFSRLWTPHDSTVVFGYYEGGHMFYTNPAALKKFKADLVKFFDRK